MRTDNRTLYGIDNSAERCLFITWTSIVVLASLIGDSLILIGTIKYRAIRMHKIIVTVMQHMAACDILLAVLNKLPVTTALIADRWILGEAFYHMDNGIYWVGSGVTMLLTCTITTSEADNSEAPIKGKCVACKTRPHSLCSNMVTDLVCYGSSTSDQTVEYGHVVLHLHLL